MSEKNYLDKTGALYEAIKIKAYVASNYATQSMLTSLSNAESSLNSTQNSQLSSLSTENINRQSDIASLSESLSEQADDIASLAQAQSEAGGNVGARLDSLSNENVSQASDIASLSLSMSELDDNIASLSTAQSEIDGTQNSSISSLAIQNSTQTVDISSLTSQNSTQTVEINSLSSAEVEIKSELVELGSEVADKTEIDDSATTTDNTWSASKIQSIVNALNSLTFAVVSVLPTTDISTRTIYLVPRTTAQTNNSFDEYMYINNKWEIIGNTDVDLSGYVQDSDLVPITDAEIDAMWD